MSVLIISTSEVEAQKYLQKHLENQENTTVNILNNIDIINSNLGVNDLSTSDIRSKLAETNMKPHSLKIKYFIVYNYDRVGERIQNMLLKTLEEGRVNVILHANTIANILPTTLSRVVVHDLTKNDLNIGNKHFKVIEAVIKNHSIGKIWDLKKEDIESFLNSLELYIKQEKPINYHKTSKKIGVLRKRLIEGIPLNKDIQLTNVFTDLI